MSNVVSAEIWARLARLDARCDFDFRRRDTAPAGQMHGSGRNFPRVWVVRIWDKAAGEGAALIVEDAWLGRALAAAVGMAEARGWAR